MTEEERLLKKQEEINKVMDSLKILQQGNERSKTITLEERQAEWDRLYDSPNSEPVKHAMPARPSLEGDQMNEDRIKRVSRNQNRFQGGMNKDDDYLASERHREEDWNEVFKPNYEEQLKAQVQQVIELVEEKSKEFKKRREALILELVLQLEQLGVIAYNQDGSTIITNCRAGQITKEDLDKLIIKKDETR